MNLSWYLVVSALIFSIGAGGVLVRRNPLVILLCIELMLNAANLALVTFARTHGNGDGQIFALIVMVVAACEVAVGLGLIVALFLTRFLVAFEIASLLLLIAAVGAVILARRRTGLPEAGEISVGDMMRGETLPEAQTGTMIEAAGSRRR